MNLNLSNKDSYFEDIVMGYSIYTINRSDIILKEKLNFLKTIFDQVQPEIPFSNYYLEDNKINLEYVFPTCWSLGESANRPSLQNILF